jgi:hypothetical protein
MHQKELRTSRTSLRTPPRLNNASRSPTAFRRAQSVPIFNPAERSEQHLNRSLTSLRTLRESYLRSPAPPTNNTAVVTPLTDDELAQKMAMEDEKAVSKELTAYCAEPPFSYVDEVTFSGILDYWAVSHYGFCIFWMLKFYLGEGISFSTFIQGRYDGTGNPRDIRSI